MIERLRVPDSDLVGAISNGAMLVGVCPKRMQKSVRSSDEFVGIWKGEGSVSESPRQNGEGSDPAGRPGREMAAREEVVPMRMNRLESPNQTPEPTRVNARHADVALGPRSEERRVGKESRARW